MILTHLIYVSIAVFIIVSMMIAAGYLYETNLIKVKTVHAGPGDKHTFKDDSSTITISPFETFYHEGKKVNSNNFEIRVAEGDCMGARGIWNGDILFIRKFKEQELKKSDILFIKKEKNGRFFYKIREFSSFNEEGKAITFSYSNDNTPIKSSSPHDLENIEGVVKMRFKYKS
jgi:hypothetical protein